MSRAVEHQDPLAAASGSPDRRPTPLSAFGEPTVWLMGGALATCLALVAVVILLIVGEGLTTLWPKPIERVELRSGETFLALPMGTETYTPTAADLERLRALDGEGAETSHEIGLESGSEGGAAPDELTRRRFRLGNRDLGRSPFRWVPEHEIASSVPAENGVVIERDEWGIFIGVPRAVVLRMEIEEPASAPFEETLRIETEHGGGVATQEIVSQAPDGTRRVRRELMLAEGPEATLEKFAELEPGARARRKEIDRLQRVDMPRVQDRLAQLRWRERRAESALEFDGGDRAPVWLWGLSVVGAVGALGGWIRHARPGAPGGRPTVSLALAAVVVVGGLFAWLERPFLRASLDEAGYAAEMAEIEEARGELIRERDTILARIRLLESKDELLRLVVEDPGLERFAPVSQSEPGEPMRLSQALRMTPVNALGWWDRLGVYLARWGDFLSRPPGESPGDGGVFPVIVGTVVLTLLLTVSVVPLGVIAAIYLREYAHQGPVTSAIRIAINNLAGVPSIVYGMFGLGFFCYTVGGYIDAGPGEAAIGRVPWWALLATLCGFVVLGGLLASVSSAASDVSAKSKSVLGRAARIGSWWIWLGAVTMAAYLVWSTPYFDGFFAEKLPEQPTFGGRGILWAALTLALLTLPVVIVATEEAIAAVPASMRAGSVGCGASRWQTIRRIVLPASMPGVLTGAILAMARGAGEVAPLMLVGAVNLAPALPVTTDPPFLHGDRTFMHLGFHIYNLGFQSPDAEAARPLVWTTTLLLVAIVLGLNLAAMIVRARLPGRGAGGGL